jgi:hypothetical protein
VVALLGLLELDLSEHRDHSLLKGRQLGNQSRNSLYTNGTKKGFDEDKSLTTAILY